MQIFLKNESDKNIAVKLNGESYSLIPFSAKAVEIADGCAELTVYADEKYRSDPVTSTLGLRYLHRFIAISTYKVNVSDDCTIRFYKETAHGNNLESYTRIYPFSAECSFSVPRYTVKDEMEIKAKIARSDKNEAVILQGAGIAGKLFKAKNKFDDMVAAIILGAIALVVFIALCIFTGFITAVTSYAYLAVGGLVIWKVFLERLIKKLKAKAKSKAEKKKDELLKNCENMPEDLFKGKESYFEHDYIKAVFELSKKRI